MGRLQEWLKSLFGVVGNAPDVPSARIKFRLERMTMPARERARQLIDQAVADFSSTEIAERWLCSQVPFLGNRRPIDIMHTKKGAAAVEHTLYNMRHGIYS